MQKKKSKIKIWNLESQLTHYPTALTTQYFQYFILFIAHFFLTSCFTLFSFLIFFSLVFSHPHTSSHTPRFPLLNFKFPLIFVNLCCLPLCVSPMRLLQQFNLMTVKYHCLISSVFSTSHSSFSPWIFLFCFCFCCKVHLFISFLSSSISLVEVLVLQSRLHADRILNFGQYLPKWTWMIWNFFRGGIGGVTISVCLPVRYFPTVPARTEWNW